VISLESLNREWLSAVDDAQERACDHHLFNGNKRIGDFRISMSLKISDFSKCAGKKFAPPGTTRARSP
jgi:hypothetical protein